MSVLVGTLAVDVVNGQATFSLDDSQSKLDSFGRKVQDTQKTVDYSMREARESIMLTSAAVGVQLPAGITRAIASIEGLGPALVAAMPYVAIVAGIVLVIDKIAKWKEEQSKLAAEWGKIGDDGTKAIRHLDDEISTAKIKADELSGNSLDALRRELVLIDHQTLDNLNSQFDTTAAKLDAILNKETRGWIMSFLWGPNGYNEVQNSFSKFNAAYEEALSSGKSSEARELLVDEIIKSQDAIAASSQYDDSSNKSRVAAYQKYLGVLQQINTEDEKGVQVADLKKHNDVTEDDQKGQKNFVHLQELIAKSKAELSKELGEEANETGKVMGERLYQGLKGEVQQSEAALKLVTAQVKNAREQAKELKEDSALNQQQDAKAQLDKLEAGYRSGLVTVREYYTQKKALTQQDLNAQVAYAQAIKAAADAQLDTANKGDSNDPSVLDARTVAIVQQQAAARALAKANEEAASSTAKLNEEERQSTTFMGALGASMKTNTTIAAQFGQDVSHAMQGANNAIAQSIVEGKNLGKAMRQVGIELVESIFKQILANYEKMAVDKMVTAQHIAGNAQQSASDKTASGESQLAAAKAAAAKAYQAMAGIPIIGPILGAVAAATVFAGAMAFEEGGIVGGYGVGDTVPAMLSPGEMVLPKPISQGLQASIQGGGTSGETHWHAPTFAPKVSAMDSSGVDKVLKKHADKFTKQFHAEMRRRNR